jgi:HD-GYP domain-containing protein (c-di-GMP phosphodiesterase class II)
LLRSLHYPQLPILAIREVIAPRVNPTHHVRLNPEARMRMLSIRTIRWLLPWLFATACVASPCQAAAEAVSDSGFALVAGDLAEAGATRKGWDLPFLFRLALGGLGIAGLVLLAALLRQRRNAHLKEIRLRESLEEIVVQRTEDLRLAQEKLQSLVENGILLGQEQDYETLLRHILVSAQELANCARGTIYLKTEHDSLVFAIRTTEDNLPSSEIPLHDPASGRANDKYVSVWVCLNDKTAVIDDVYSETRFDLSGTKRFSEQSGFRTVSMLSVPMSPRDGEVIGVLQLLNALDPATGEVVPFSPGIIPFVEALAAQSGVALDNHNLIVAQRRLMDSMIQLIAGAIDAKSPYTGGHCERVPELAMMLAEEATKAREGPLADFGFHSEDEWREFRIGAWLHDCGKVTTPEYVVDKATKLETLYNRIHEIRMRFEVLLRDAHIARLEALAAGTEPAAAEFVFQARRAQLIDDFAFVAECNLGGEFMAPERVERLKRIAGETWQRHFDDRLGLAHAELKRYVTDPAPLPATEHLLADKPEHILPRDPNPALDPSHGFKMKVPKHLYNQGEVYNLGIARGTLTEEDRFKINEHIIQTIVMLEKMPFPANLKRVPEYAGTHHETLIGTGYPRQLTQAELSVPSRIMAIADIFEALTASDRPYKKAKTLSESIKILSFFKKDKHIDPDLFELFLRSGVYRRYAEKYLSPEQIDSVDIADYL